MCSRLLGLVREQVFAGLFGAGYAYDAFVVAFRIPNLLRDLFGEGALSAAFVSVFSDYDANRSREQTWLLASNVLCFFLIAVSIITLLGMLFADQIVAVLAPSFSEISGKAELTAAMTVIMMPFLLFISLAAVVMGILNTKNRFFIPSLASSFFNLGSIIGGGGLALILPTFGYPAIVGMAFGTLLGGCLQLCVQLPVLKQVGFKFSFTLKVSDPGLKRVLKLMVPATIGLSATQINIFINTNFASSCVEGSVSWLNYAFRLVQLPIGLFGVAISIAALPLLARHASTNNLKEMRETFVSSLTMVFCLTIPATIGLILLSEPIIKVIFEHGAFTAADTEATAVALSLYGVGLFAYSANKVIVPVFYAINATRYPVIASFLAIGCNVLIIVNTIDHFQHRAIALSTSTVMILNFLFLAAVLYRKIDGFSVQRLFSGIVRIVGATLVMTGVLIGVYKLLAGNFQQTIAHQLLALLIIIGASSAVYLITLNLTGLKEIDDILAKIRQRLSD